MSTTSLNTARPTNSAGATGISTLSLSASSTALAVAVTLAGAVVSGWLYPWHPGGDIAHAGRWVIALVTLYLPALAMVLRPVPVRVAQTA